MTEQSIIKKEFNLTNSDWYNALVEECHAITVEHEFNARFEVIRGKWELGKRIVEDENYNKFGRGNRQFISQLAGDLKCSEQNIYFSTQFYEKFKDYNALEKLPEGKNISWYKITQTYLGKRDENKGTARRTYRVDEVLDAVGKFLKVCLNHEDDQIKIYIEEFQREYLNRVRK